MVGLYKLLINAVEEDKNTSKDKNEAIAVSMPTKILIFLLLNDFLGAGFLKSKYLKEIEANVYEKSPDITSKGTKLVFPNIFLSIMCDVINITIKIAV